MERVVEDQGPRVSVSGDVEVSTYLGIAKEKDRREAVSAPPPPAKRQETIVVLDFGSQYSMLIARRVREMNVYCELVPHDTSWERIEAMNPKGFILSGGPASVYEDDAPFAPAGVFDQRVPVLGICYGMQLMAHQLGGRVEPSERREYGHAVLHQNDEDFPLFENVPSSVPVWMSHGDKVAEMPQGFRSLAFTDNSPVAVMGNDAGLIGLQFHPEVVHTQQGKEVIRNFLYNLCGCAGDWTPANFIEEQVTKIRPRWGRAA